MQETDGTRREEEEEEAVRKKEKRADGAKSMALHFLAEESARAEAPAFDGRRTAPYAKPIILIEGAD